MVKSNIIKEWLKFADEDFDFASAGLGEYDRFYSQICFHFQQAGEKYLKAFIIANKLLFKKIHNLAKLLEICQEKDTSFKTLIKEARLLTDYYVNTRYPVVWPINTTRKEAEKAYRAAKKIGSFVKNKLKQKK